MAQLLPVNSSLSPPGTAAPTGTEGTSVPGPPPAGDLRDWSQETYDLTGDLAVSLGFAVAQLAGSSSRRVLLFEASRSTELDAGEHVYRFGVALRVVVEVLDVKGSGGLTLPALAAKVELEGARATSRLSVRGYKGDDLGPLLPAWTSFGVDQYAGYMKAVSDLQAKIMANSEAIEPELLATSATPAAQDRPPPSAALAVAEVYALDAIAHRLTLADALHRFPQLDDVVLDVLRQTYGSMAGEDELARPEPDTAERAKVELRGLRLRHGLFGL